MKALFVFLVLILSIRHVVAFEIKGQLQPGGLIHTQLEPGSSAILNGNQLSVSRDGLLVFGFSRDASVDQVLEIKEPDGSIKKQKLTLQKRNYKVQKIHGLPKNKVIPPIAQRERIASERRLISTTRNKKTNRRDFLRGFSWPVKGRISGVFGSQRILNGVPRSPHYGLDIAAPEGTPVLAASSGVISLAHENMFFTGKTILIDHGFGVSTIYVHLSEISVEVGQNVERGQLVGRVGMTGRATGPHLHWGLSWGQVRLDPQLVVSPMMN
ncbi:MAG: M23 family metallopeptidase [Pseudomonadota bacterium]|nr:M23 family metallopeptidase [Pseudomonadota bacterium]